VGKKLGLLVVIEL